MVISGGLSPLEFADCLLDSPDFRENLNRHEKELEKTSQQIKRIIKEIKELMQAAKNLSRCQRTLAKSLNEFNFECIGSTQTDDEQVIAASLKQFSKLISAIEDERDNMLDRAHDQIVVPLEGFRKDAIGSVKEKKKQHDKKTAKFCQAQEKILNLSSKKPETVVVEADAALDMLKREYIHESLNYVLKIQEVQERIKFEFVEILLGFMSGWLVFYHLGHEVAEDAKEYMTDLQHKVQKTREGYTEFREIAKELKSKYMHFQLKPESEYTNQGYLYLMEKKAFTATWQKYYCTYKKENKQFTMLQYNQQIPGRIQSTPEKLTLASCTRCISDFEKRFCFDLTFDQKPNIVYTMQALSEKDRKAWLDAMDGKEPVYLTPGKSTNTVQEDEYILDEVGFAFVKKCIETLEKRGLEEEGLYRVSGVGTKINKLLQLGLDSKKTETERLAIFTEDQHLEVLESKTIASALKQYLRKLKEPLMTYRYFNGFLSAAKQEQHIQRISDVHALTHRLPKNHFEMLDIIVQHLKKVASKSHKNKMSIFNLGVVFGPTLLKASEDSLAAVLEIKFNNLVIEILIENYELIFKNLPGKSSDYVSRNSSLSPPFQRSSNYNYRESSAVGEQRSHYPQPIRGVNSQQSTPPSYSLYETKSSTNINQKSLSPIMRGGDASLSSRELSSVTNYLKSASPPTTLNNNSYQNAIYVQKQQFYNNVNKFARDNAPNATTNLSRSGGLLDSSYGTVTNQPLSQQLHNKSVHHNILTSSDTNLSKLFDRVHSSDESVCSSSSRDLNLASQQQQQQSQQNQQSQHHYPLYGTTRELNKSISGSNKQLNIWSDFPRQPQTQTQPPQATQQIYNDVISTSHSNNNGSGHIPKKQERGHKDKDEIVKAKPYNIQQNCRVRTLYACLAENEGELSFEPNQIIINVCRSNEPGWLHGTLNGKSGLIPENYCEFLN
ncbi:rho GTPase-activating protein Graf isoform X2 [Chironomus tepperi]|uniref:rho GTPase-activating protein Graf isoform X2 n=1 Tax=Chironomus tepperi TaxID=113505 RepID=UPI00391F6234